MKTHCGKEIRTHIKIGQSSIPMDVFFHVVLYLEPPDIMRLRRTSRDLYAFTHEDIIWIRALRLACQQHGVVFPIPSEQTASGKKPRHEDVVTGLYRFSDRLRAVSQSKDWKLRLEPCRTSTIRRQAIRKVTGGGKSKTRFRSLALVPGGRFLLTVAGDLVFSLQLWGLGGPRSDRQPTLKAEVTLPLYINKSESLVFVTRVKSVLIGGVKRIVVLVVARRKSDVLTGAYLVYYVEPGAERDVQIIRIGKFTFLKDDVPPNESCGEWLSPHTDHLVIRRDRTKVFVWDYEEDTISTIRLPDRDPLTHGVTQMTLINNRLITWNSIAIESYILPPFYPTAEGQYPTTPPAIPLTYTNLPHNCHIAVNSIPYLDPNGAHITFHLIGQGETEKICKIHCYTASFEHSESSSTGDQVITHHTNQPSHHFTHCDPTPYPFGRKLFQTCPKLPFQDQVLMWADVVPNTMPVESSETVSLKVYNRGLEYDIELLKREKGHSGFRYDEIMDECSVSFCPFSGRLCYIGISDELDEQLGGLTIQILDYVHNNGGSIEQQKPTKS